MVDILKFKHSYEWHTSLKYLNLLNEMLYFISVLKLWNLIFILGPPDQPTNCSVLNQTTDSLEVQCLPGFNGGLQQSFLLEVTDIQTKMLLANATDKIPEFTVKINLPFLFFHAYNRLSIESLMWSTNLILLTYTF